ncbi:DUF3224 domain-containing protein [Kribbella sp. NPDC023855]|uniref:DUF3224 domain-containing protein n=1 Tax=Kribbella sp. NPDC023855 TaxID=3154698 RepID=UPI0033CCE546
MRFTQAFEITKWDQSDYDDAGDLTLGRAVVGKNFSSAELEGAGLDGTSSAELLMVGTPAGPAAYTAVERFTGTLAGREGTFVMVHGASADQDSSPGKIVAADGDLTGITGTVVFEHDDKGPRLTLDYELP